MRNKGVGFDSHVVLSWTESNDIAVTIHYRDRREGAAEVEKTMTFKERGHKLFPKDYGDDFMRAYRQIEGWLVCMGVNDACHADVIEDILQCSKLKFRHPLAPLKLDVFVELTDDCGEKPRLKKMWWMTTGDVRPNLKRLNSLSRVPSKDI